MSDEFTCNPGDLYRKKFTISDYSLVYSVRHIQGSYYKIYFYCFKTKKFYWYELMKKDLSRYFDFIS